MPWKAINLSGQQIYRWTVLKRVDDIQGRSAWLCRCVCGVEKVLLGKELNRRRTKSCGCLRKDLARQMCFAHRLPQGQASKNLVLGFYKNNAKKRGRAWSLSDEEFFTLTQQRCFYCGVKPILEYHGHNTFGSYTYNGLDRKNNEEGYTQSNCVPCCKECNYAKASRTYEEFTQWLLRIRNYFLENNNVQ